MQTKQFSNAPKFSLLQQFAIVVQTGTIENIRSSFAVLRSLPEFQSKGWVKNFTMLDSVFNSGTEQFSIFALGGNSKLPFIAFSTLPGVTCPGAGLCLKFCYSFRAWRFPASFARQCQNAFLLRFFPQIIRDSFSSIAKSRPDGFDFRLYVDGDFSSVHDVEFWMSIINDNPNARTYGYSKSFNELLAYGKTNLWPANYMLNISSGHNADSFTLEAARSMPITRGEFRAISVGRVVKASEHGTYVINTLLRAAVPDKIFPCPGSCGKCTGAGHACGLPQLKGRIIAIAVH